MKFLYHNFFLNFPDIFLSFFFVGIIKEKKVSQIIEGFLKISNGFRNN